MKRIFAMTATLFCVLFSGAVTDATASLIAVDDPIFGAGTWQGGTGVTRDTSTSLEWLNLGYTTGYGYNEVIANQGPGGTFAGWRYASAAEVMTLWMGAGLPDSINGFTDGLGVYTDAVTTVQSMVGALKVPSTTSGYYLSVISAGMVSDAFPGSLCSYLALFQDISSGPDVRYANSSNGLTPFNGFGYDMSSWLVRESAPDPVPEPSTMYLIGSSLLVVAARRFKNARAVKEERTFRSE
jgi:PEP-CTERM motif-containing protein